MNKRETILMTAARQIHENGYHHVGIKSILDELQIPKGSFYHFFKSKEALGLEIIQFYIEDTKSCIAGVEDSLQGLEDFFNIFFNRLRQLELRRGCPVGNLILELSDDKEVFREKLSEWYELVITWVSDILRNNGIDQAAIKAKALFAAFEGAMLTSKVNKKEEHFNIFIEVTLKSIIG
ncbi:TetR/AcrR family transcriptional regulator [Acidaminobacter sp. JC074]|uniref:TetR/AcrR family transcriptional regulator n=1 Tax=Acidaminobacter sp. JC074 TaxID=2530199 RepID=UPI001F0D6868|nr:TetR/AcrR family transcriptional regulator [Acidaminobacter sp. JC074]MCH4888419.1 TetR/AcrR family transcriptional regulator [Acidaminobacter sp. JC074]